MKKILVLILAVLVASCAYQVRTYDKVVITQEEPVKIEPPALELKVGEKLIYAVDWLGIPSGWITLETVEITQLDDRPVYHIIARASVNKLMKFLYNMEYTVHTYIDKEKLRPVKFFKQRKVGNKVVDEEIDFIYEENKVIWKYSSPKNQRELSMPKEPQDLLSLLYYFRLKDIEIYKNYFVDVAYGGMIWPADITLEGIKDIEINNLGHFRTVIVRTVSQFLANITGSKEIYINFSLDAKRIPLIYRVPSKVGYFTGILISYRECKNLN